jgi:hypothetical protein
MDRNTESINHQHMICYFAYAQISMFSIKKPTDGPSEADSHLAVDKTPCFIRTTKFHYHIYTTPTKYC